MPTSPRPDFGLLLPCADPALVPDPETATAKQIAVERRSVAQWGLCNKRKFVDLSTWVRDILLGGAPLPTESPVKNPPAVPRS